MAIEFEAQRLSYRELNGRANRLAYHLRTLGVGPDQRVAICVQRSPELVEGTLAVLEAGGAYVPLGPAYPTERLGYMLRDSAPVVLLTQTEWRDRLALADATPSSRCSRSTVPSGRGTSCRRTTLSPHTSA